MTPLSSPHSGQNCHFLSGALFWGVSAGKLAQGYVTLDSKLKNTWDCVDQLGDIQGKSEWTSNWKTQFVVAYLHVSAEWDMKSMWDKTYPILVAKEEDKKCLFFFSIQKKYLWSSELYGLHLHQTPTTSGWLATLAVHRLNEEEGSIQLSLCLWQYLQVKNRK